MVGIDQVLVTQSEIEYPTALQAVMFFTVDSIKMQAELSAIWKVEIFWRPDTNYYTIVLTGIYRVFAQKELRFQIHGTNLSTVELAERPDRR